MALTQFCLHYHKYFPPEAMERLSRVKGVKVPYDAQDNRHLHDAPNVEVDGLSSYFHRMLSLGHDPVWGFIFGVYDILNCKMTTISKSGVFTSQDMSRIYVERTTSDVLEAISMQWRHLKSDVNTSMGLPVPLMCFFNALQFGEIGNEKNTIAEVVQGMYYEGYDFRHFLAMSIPMMLVEILVRAYWWLRNHATLSSTPVFIGRDRNPKLETMLCLAHATMSATNVVKVRINKNPCAINYPEWCRFLELASKEAKFQIIDKSIKRQSYVRDRIMSQQ